jgi:hypothetical protein
LGSGPVCRIGVWFRQKKTREVRVHGGIPGCFTGASPIMRKILPVARLNRDSFCANSVIATEDSRGGFQRRIACVIRRSPTARALNLCQG